ncbi:MAG: GDP-L-fucose synthase [Candidatus Marinimicrobia bacterium]|nr:GDP-L-fucose synthase [Candidatus Neomarinimicrobiota bacterium]
MNKKSKIYIAGHNGMVGSAIWRNLETMGYANLIGKSSKKLDLRNQAQVEAFFAKEKPEYVFLAAAKVGGILANDTYRAEFIYDNLQIQNNVIHQSYVHGVKKLLFLGSSCIYPRDCPQPMKEEYLLTGELEQTNEPYAIAKIAGIKMCESYNRQYGTNFLSVMPTNLYGPGDNYDLEKSHVLPALLRKFHLGKCLENDNWDSIRVDLNKNPIKEINGNASQNEILKTLKNHGISIISDKPTSDLRPQTSEHLSPASFLLDPASSSLSPVTNKVVIPLWGTGTPLREFLHVDDLANACTFLMESVTLNLLPDSSSLSPTSCLLPPFYNIGSGEELAIKDLTFMIKDIVGFQGDLHFDTSMPDGTPRKLLDVTKMSELGWDSKIRLDKGIYKVYKDYSEN